MRRISFFIILFVLFFIISSMLLLIWWPVKATLVEITNSWVAVIMVYLILIVFLYEKPLYELYDEFIDFENPVKHHSQQSNKKEIFKYISDDNFTTPVTYRDPKWESILEKESKQDIYPGRLIDEATEYIQELQVKRVKWCFLFADTYLVIQAKYILFWFYKFKNVNLDNFHHVWEEKISDFTEQEALLEALLNLEFLKENESVVSITELGSAYVNYLKKLDKQIDNHEKTIIPTENESE